WSRLAVSLFRTVPAAGPAPAPIQALDLTESMADLEYAVKTHETFRRLFGRWLRVHILISFVLYGLLALHVWAAIRYGLRWFAGGAHGGSGGWRRPRSCSRGRVGPGRWPGPPPWGGPPPGNGWPARETCRPRTASSRTTAPPATPRSRG